MRKRSQYLLVGISIFILSYLGCSPLIAQQRKGMEAIEIDAAYMKANIYDWEKNPTKFVYKGGKPCVIDFYADWCGPCRALAPKLAEVAGNYVGKIVVYKVNIDKEKELAKLFKVQSIPMLLFVPMKETPYVSMGNVPKEYIKDAIDKIL